MGDLFERVLVPIDGVGTAKAVLPHLRPFVRRRRAEIVFLEIAAPPDLLALEAEPEAGPRWATPELAVADLVDLLRGQGFRARGITPTGFRDPARIVQSALQEKATLIAMGTHAQASLSRFVWGSTTEGVIRKSPIPVLVVAHALPAAPEAAPARALLVSADKACSAARLLGPIAALSATFGANVYLIPADGPSRPPVEACAMMLSPEAPVETIARKGDSVRRIIDGSRQVGAGLVVIAAGPGYTPLSRGRKRVLREVLRSSPVPVLVMARAG